MKSPKAYLLIASLLFTAGGLFAQEVVNKGDVIIHIQMYGASVYGKTLVDIYKLSDQAKIIYAREDIIQFTKARKDTAYINVSRNLNYSDQKQAAKLAEIIEKYSVYDTTAVVINLKKDTAYSKTLQLMAQTSKTELETSKVGTRVTLDGFSFYATIITATGTKTITALTPAANSHPIIAEFLKETTEMVRSKKRK